MSKRAVLAAVAVSVAVAAFLGAGAPSVTTFKDSRDGKVYKIVTIGKQVWMAENLNYDVPDDTTDACYNNNAGNCAKYGGLRDGEGPGRRHWHWPEEGPRRRTPEDSFASQKGRIYGRTHEDTCGSEVKYMPL